MNIELVLKYDPCLNKLNMKTKIIPSLELKFMTQLARILFWQNLRNSV